MLEETDTHPAIEARHRRESNCRLLAARSEPELLLVVGVGNGVLLPTEATSAHQHIDSDATDDCQPDQREVEIDIVVAH